MSDSKASNGKPTADGEVAPGGSTAPLAPVVSAAGTLKVLKSGSDPNGADAKTTAEDLEKFVIQRKKENKRKVELVQTMLKKENEMMMQKQRHISRIRRELAKVDRNISDQINTIRNKIDVVDRGFSQAARRFKAAEKTYLECKRVLDEKKAMKALLSEHLAQILMHNEQEKAVRLENLMREFKIEEENSKVGGAAAGTESQASATSQAQTQVGGAKRPVAVKTATTRSPVLAKPTGQPQKKKGNPFKNLTPEEASLFEKTPEKKKPAGPKKTLQQLREESRGGGGGGGGGRGRGRGRGRGQSTAGRTSQSRGGTSQKPSNARPKPKTRTSAPRGGWGAEWGLTGDTRKNELSGAGNPFGTFAGAGRPARAARQGGKFVGFADADDDGVV